MNKAQRKTPREKNIYILGGVDDFLTTTARVHKRNLLYSSLICFLVSLVAFDKSFSSIFGFKLSGEDISANIIIATLIMICCYECISLWLCLKTCKSHWQGESLLNLINTESESKGPDRFKKLISASLLIDNEDIKDFEERLKVQAEEFKLQQSNLYELMERMMNCKDDLIREYAQATIKHVESERRQVEMAIETNQEYIPESMKSNWDAECYRVGKVFSKIESKLSFVDSISDRHGKMAQYIKRLELYSRDWRSSMDQKIKTLDDNSREIKKIILDINDSCSRQICIHFTFPTVISFISVSIGLMSIMYPTNCELINSFFETMKNKL